MANFQFTVNTEPLAEQVSTVSHHVTGVTVAVTAMQAAVIAAERESAEEICANVDRGFYFLIKSQISQKAAKLNSEVTSRLMVLGQLGIALKSVRRQMEGDYAMITARYIKLFKTLDDALRTRVFELDKTASRLALSQRSDVASRLRDMGSALIVHQRESVPVAQIAVSSRVKRDAARGLEGIAGKLREEATLTEQLKQVVSDEATAGRAVLQMPVIVSEVDSLATGGQYSALAIPPLPGSFSALRAPVDASVREQVRGASWQEADVARREAVSSSFSLLLDQQELDERVKREMLKLFDASAWQEMGARA